MTNAILFSLLLAGAAASATELTVQPLSAQSRYIEIPAEGGPLWKFEQGDEWVEVRRDGKEPNQYKITLLQLDKDGSSRALTNSVYLEPGRTESLGGSWDDKRGMTIYLVSVALPFTKNGDEGAP
ncbi:hypothetical protein ACL00X_00975 [Aeromonas diversa]|uniref:hypothetical protein n=1 Tax=Aeromonas diversa TaxID=502790 RepID=UPI0039A33C8A